MNMASHRAHVTVVSSSALLPASSLWSFRYPSQLKGLNIQSYRPIPHLSQIRPFYNVSVLIYWRSRSPIVCFHPLVTWEGEFYMSYIQWNSDLLRKAEKSPTWPGCNEGFGVTTKIVMLIASFLTTAGRAVLLEKNVQGCIIVL